MNYRRDLVNQYLTAVSNAMHNVTHNGKLGWLDYCVIHHVL